MKGSARMVMVAVVAAAGACGEITAPDPGGFAEVRLDAEVVHAYTEFGFGLFGRLAEGALHENLFVSPTSAAFALAMAHNGAAGETRDGMARALGVDALGLDKVNAAGREWLAALQSTGDPRVELLLANSIWARQGFPFHETFFHRSRDFYAAEVRELPFDAAAIAAINGWAAAHTRGRIDEVIDEISGDDVMFLLNALYFKGEWRYRFDEKETRPRPFTRPDGSQVEVPMMNQRAELPYRRGDGFQMVALPYGNGRFEMVLALPDHGRSLGDLYAQLSPASWDAWRREMAPTEVGVILPRFRMEWEATLNDPLIDMGMERAFSRGLADFTDLSPAGRQLYIGFVRQKTFLEVDERGTEAAAVTVVGLRVICACGPEYPVLEFDRPFFLAIRDNATGTVLFLGHVNDPTEG